MSIVKSRSFRILAFALFLSLVIIGTVGAVGTGAWFSDTETSNGNVFTAGSLDLVTDSQGSVPFVISDVVPSDNGTGTITVTNVEGSIPGVLSMHWTKTIDDENDMIEPETARYPRPDGSPGLTTGDYNGNGGELDFFLQFAPFVDVNKDGVFNSGDIQLAYNGQHKTFPGYRGGDLYYSGLNSYTTAWSNFIELNGGASVNIVIPWRFPEESTDANYSQNMAMTDSLGFDIELTLNQVH